MANYKLIIAYDGRKYNGWQKQGNTRNTIQEKIEETLSRLTGEKIEINGSGRTDAGVHALGQVANFHTNKWFEDEMLRDSMNEYLPKDIRIQSVSKVDERFHARLNAKGKRYVYRIDNRVVSDPFIRKYRTRVEKPLDINAMKQAAGYLLGEHDFTAFCSYSGKKSKIRTIREIRIIDEKGQVDIDIYGNGFLYNMVRIIAGTLIAVGLHKMPVTQVRDALEQKDRKLAGITAPPTGLFLVEVEY